MKSVNHNLPLSQYQIIEHHNDAEFISMAACFLYTSCKKLKETDTRPSHYEKSNFQTNISADYFVGFRRKTSGNCGDIYKSLTV
jgi:hypothetical protein